MCLQRTYTQMEIKPDTNSLISLEYYRSQFHIQKEICAKIHVIKINVGERKELFFQYCGILELDMNRAYLPS